MQKIIFYQFVLLLLLIEYSCLEKNKTDEKQILLKIETEKQNVDKSIFAYPQVNEDTICLDNFVFVETVYIFDSKDTIRLCTKFEKKDGLISFYDYQYYKETSAIINNKRAEDIKSDYSLNPHMFPDSLFVWEQKGEGVFFILPSLPKFCNGRYCCTINFVILFVRENEDIITYDICSNTCLALIIDLLVEKTTEKNQLMIPVCIEETSLLNEKQLIVEFLSISPDGGVFNQNENLTINIPEISYGTY